MKTNGKRNIELKGYSNSLNSFPLEIKVQCDANHETAIVVSLLANFNLSKNVHLRISNVSRQVIFETDDCQHNGHYAKLLKKLDNVEIVFNPTSPPNTDQTEDDVDPWLAWRQRKIDETIALAKFRWVDSAK